MTRSSSAGYTLNPAVRIMSFRRSTIQKYPSSSSRARSPECSQPSGSMVSRVAVSFP